MPASGTDVLAPTGVPLFPEAVLAAGRAGAAIPAAALGGAGAGELRLAQLLCARVCHDLIGAAGAIETGIDLLAEESADRDDICDLIGLSGRQLNRRLAFYRLVFGMSGQAGDFRPLSEAKRLAEGFLDGGRVSLRWQVEGMAGPDSGLGGNEIRLLLGVVLVAAEGLRRGGLLTVRLEEVGAGVVLTVDAAGRDAAVAEGAEAALAGKTPLDAVTARTVPAYYLRRQLRSLAGELELMAITDGFQIRIALEGGAS